MFKLKVIDKIKIHILNSVIIFSENITVYEIISKYMVQPLPADDKMATRWCWISKATLAQEHANARAPPHTHTHTNSEYVILIAFPRQRLFRERASMLRYSYIACLSNISF